MPKVKKRLLNPDKRTLWVRVAELDWQDDVGDIDQLVVVSEKKRADFDTVTDTEWLMRNAKDLRNALRTVLPYGVWSAFQDLVLQDRKLVKGDPDG